MSMSFRSRKIGDTILPFPGQGTLIAPDATPLLPVLIVLHQETSTPGRVGNALRALGYRLDIRRPRFGDPLPETLDQHAGAVIFGGPMSANDSDDYVRREIDWIEVPLREQRPFLGICLGAQMLAKQLGAQVAPHHEGRVEVGYYPVTRCARTGRSVSTTGTAKDFNCRAAQNCSPKATIFRCRPISTVRHSASSFILM
jgi:GMP synthase (glutamine-hydrolysing)